MRSVHFSTTDRQKYGSLKTIVLKMVIGKEMVDVGSRKYLACIGCANHSKQQFRVVLQFTHPSLLARDSMLRRRSQRRHTVNSDLESDKKPFCGLRLAHKQTVDGQKPARSSPLPYNIIVPTQRRERATEGLIMGCAIAEALSLARTGLHPRVGLKLFGRNPLQFQFQPGIGVTSHRTHALLMTFQAMLQSKSDPNIFAKNWFGANLPII